jgi:hypothetical protein
MSIISIFFARVRDEFGIGHSAELHWVRGAKPDSLVINIPYFSFKVYNTEERFGMTRD